MTLSELSDVVTLREFLQVARMSERRYYTIRGMERRPGQMLPEPMPVHLPRHKFTRRAIQRWLDQQ